MKIAHRFLATTLTTALLCVYFLPSDASGQGFSGYGTEATRPRSVLQRSPTDRVAQKSAPGNQAAFPYKAYAAVGGGAVYSGPSTQFYQTSSIPAGQSVDVYRHDPNGWLAIRPPEDDFSLVRSRDLVGTAKPGVFRVVREGAKAWIGTRINKKHQPVTQVKLNKGELVAVISTLSAGAGNEAESWYQIRPPRGEFRWVHQSQFQRKAVSSIASNEMIGNGNQKLGPNAHFPESSKGLGVINAASSGSNSVQPLHGIPGKGIVSSMQGEQLMNGGGLPKDSVKESPWQASKQRQPEVIADHRPDSEIATDNGNRSRTTAQPAGFVSSAVDSDIDSSVNSSMKDIESQVTGAAADWEAAIRRLRSAKGGFYQPASENSDAALQNRSIDSTQPVSGSDGSNGFISGNGISNQGNAKQGRTHFRDLLDESKGWEQQLNQLNILTNKQVVLPTNRWDLRPILQAAQYLGSTARSTDQRNKAASLQRRLEQFLQLQSRNPTSSDLSAGLQGRRFASRGSGTGLLSGSTAGGQTQKQHPYDAVGFLKEMVLDRGNMASTFVLQDEAGRPICHVMKMPGGVDLRPYLNKKVGVTGDKGYHNRLKLPHVTIRRIVPLGG